MSRRESGGRPVSPGASASPPTLPVGQRGSHDVSATGDAPFSSSSLPRTNGGSQPPTPSQRSFGVHHILNPAESQGPPTASVPPPAVERGPGITHLSPTRRHQETGRPISQQWRFENQGSGAPAEANLTPRGSPVAHHSFPTLNVPPGRRYLTPRSPRAVSMSHAASLRGQNPQQPGFQHKPEAQDLPPHQGGAGSTEHSPRSTSSQPHGSPYATAATARSRLAPYSTPPRSVSQPVGGFGPHHQVPPLPAQPQGGPPPMRTQPPSLVPSPTPYTTALPPGSRGFPPPLQHGDTRFPGPHGPGGASGGMSGPDQAAAASEAPATPVSTGQPLFSINPMHGESMVIPVEMYQGSREANEKRLRNAGASARFRQRKKSREAHKDMSLQRLESTNRDLERRIQEIEEEREFYRAERNRLRDVVARTPSISELAYQSPPSPRHNMVDSYSASGSMTPTPLTPIAPHPMASTSPESGPVAHFGADERPSRRSAPEPLAGERDTRRRRTESARIEFTIPPYSATTTPGSSGALPSIPPPSPPVYSAMMHPGTPSAVSRPSMLPPLRMEQPPGQPPQQQHPPPPLSSQQQQHQQQHHHQPQQQYPQQPPIADPHAAQYRRDSNAYESGWATSSHGPPPQR